jgi:sigma-B regulation protein RsbU (phosphoserine phosphatase)
MGHGVIASLMAFSLRDILPALGGETFGKALGPAEIVRALYERYERGGESAMGATFFTIAYGEIEIASGAYRIARAGYTPVLHLEAGGRMRVHYTKGAAVGVTREAEIEEATGTLASGDRLLVASDGLLAAFGDGLLESSLETLSAFADGFRGAALEAFVDAFRRRSREASAGEAREDDVSLLVIERS